MLVFSTVVGVCEPPDGTDPGHLCSVHPGWRVTTGDAREDRYKAMDPRLLFACANFVKARDALKDIEDETARENEEIRLAPRRYAEALLQAK